MPNSIRLLANGNICTTSSGSAVAGCCETPGDCCTNTVARLPDEAGSAVATLSASVNRSVVLEVFDANGALLPWASSSFNFSVSVSVTLGVSETPWNPFGVTCQLQRATGGVDVGSVISVSGSIFNDDTVATASIRESKVFVLAVPETADPTRFARILTGFVVVDMQLNTGTGLLARQSLQKLNFQAYYRPLDGKSFVILWYGHDDRFLVVNGGMTGEAEGIGCTGDTAQCISTPVFPGPTSTSASGTRSIDATCVGSGVIFGQPVTFKETGTGNASVSLNLFGMGWTPCPGKTLPPAVAADCDDPEVIDCRDANGAIIDPQCCDPINPLPPDDPRCSDVGVGAGCCQDIGVAPYFIADDAYAIVLLYWFYRRISFFTNPNRWVADEVYVGEASLRVNLPRSGSPECSFRVSSAILAGGVNQTGQRFSQRWLNFGTENNPDWRVEQRNFLSEFTFGQSTSARLRHRIFTTATGLSNAHFDATSRAVDPKCIRGTQTRQVVGWNLQCAQGQWPTTNSGFYTQFLLRDTRPGLPTNGSIQGVQSDGEVNASAALYRFGACPNPNALLLSGQTGGALRLAENDANRDLMLSRVSRRLVNDQETPGLREAMLAYGAEGRAALRVAAGRSNAQTYADRLLLRGRSGTSGRSGRGVTEDVDGSVLAQQVRSLGTPLRYDRSCGCVRETGGVR